ncbi:hypothetical protein [Krasilnikovia sp. MM14-A1004]|uniref:hypothetical protein n=1 Tax=Krasilnikovia sp. MM14-A1004 TaxID=3373541 RepID=UPI00399D440E
MKIFTIQRPSLLPVAACAPSASWLPSTARVAVLAVERAPLSQAHQVQSQAELALLAGVDAKYGTTGFKGSNSVSKKRMTDGASGVPPRGRPV